LNIATWVTEWASDLTRRQVNRRTSELKHKVASYGISAGLGVAAAVFALLGVGFLVVACVAALALVLPTWAALLCMAGATFVVAGVLAAFAKRAVHRRSGS